MIINTPVYVALDGAEAVQLQPIAIECPACFAIVRTLRLEDHHKAAHGKAAE